MGDGNSSPGPASPPRRGGGGGGACGAVEEPEVRPAPGTPRAESFVHPPAPPPGRWLPGCSAGLPSLCLGVREGEPT